MSIDTTTIIDTTVATINNTIIKEENTMNLPTTINTAIVATNNEVLNAEIVDETAPINYDRIPSWSQNGYRIAYDANTNVPVVDNKFNWIVEKKPLLFDEMGDLYNSGLYGIVRNDTHQCFGTCKDKYQLFQNVEAFNWCLPLVESGLFKWDSAGMFRGGRVNWILLDAGDREIIPNDKLRHFLLFTWSHDGKRSISIIPTSIRIACMNTLNRALRDKEAQKAKTKIPHFITMRPKLEMVRVMYEASRELFDAQSNVYRKMLNTRLSNSEEEAFIQSVMNIMYPTKADKEKQSVKAVKHMDSVREKFYDSLTSMIHGGASKQKELGIENTLYGAFNATTEFIEHYMTQRGEKDGYSVLFGDRGEQIGQIQDLAEMMATGIDKFTPAFSVA